MNTTEKKGYLADLSLLLVAFIWGSGFVISKNAVNDVSPMMLMTVRFTIAFVLSLIFFHKKIKKINKKTLQSGVIMGIFLFLAFSTQMIGIKYTLAGKQAFLTGTNVVIVPFIYWLVKKQRPNKYNLFAAILMFVGIALLTIDFTNFNSFNIGDILTLFCAVLFACHIVSTGIFSKHHDPIALSIVQFGVCSICSILYVTISNSFTLNYSIDAWLNLGYLGFLATFVCFVIQTVAQKYTSSTHAAIIMCLESVIGSILAVVFLHDSFNMIMIFGCIIIFIAIITAETQWSFLSRKKLEENKI
jgi:drug/metabolite transporter (DMT)-like permease